MPSLFTALYSAFSRVKACYDQLIAQITLRDPGEWLDACAAPSAPTPPLSSYRRRHPDHKAVVRSRPTRDYENLLRSCRLAAY